MPAATNPTHLPAGKGLHLINLPAVTRVLLTNLPVALPVHLTSLPEAVPVHLINRREVLPEGVRHEVPEVLEVPAVLQEVLRVHRQVLRA